VLELFTFDNAVALVTLTGLEIVLGIDNVVFIALVVGKLPKTQQARARHAAWDWPCSCASCCCWRSAGSWV
jgi:predicted tellurium resistance membrane protein TerC